MQGVKYLLDPIFQRYHRPGYLNSDPLEFVYRFEDPFDQEIVALIAAVLAYGNVTQVRKSVSTALERMEQAGYSPSEFVAATASEPEATRQVFEGFIHRFNRGVDLWTLLRLMHESIHRYGSVGAHFLIAHSEHAPTIEGALDAFMTDWRNWERDLPAFVPRSKTFSYFLTAPRDGSCCKRWCMLLRWMGRKDGLDPGLWTKGSPLAHTFPLEDGQPQFLRPHQLVIPLDTHTGRISQYLGLTMRQSLNWKAALEVSHSLKSADPLDPVKYDFALSRLGILDICVKKYRAEICMQCELKPGCQFAQSKERSKKPKVRK